MSAKTLITGANGFIGTEIANYFYHKGHSVIGVTRAGTPKDNYSKIYKSELGQALPAEIFNENRISLVIHCAVAIGENEYELNVEGTKLWAEQFIKHGIERQVFFSSVSAISGNDTAYAKSKSILEKWFISRDYLVLRFGLVLGNGGIFFKLKSMVKKLPVLPLLGGGTTQTYITGIGDICSCMEKILESDKMKVGVFNFFQKSSIELREFLKIIRKVEKTFCLFIPVPTYPLYVAILFVELILPIKLPISSSSIRGMIKNDVQQLDSNMNAFEIDGKAIDLLIQNLR